MAEKSPKDESLRQTIERVMRGGEAMEPSEIPANSFLDRIGLQEIIVFVTGELIALPFAFSGAEAFMKGDYIQCGKAYAVGLPFAVGGLTFHYWKRLLGENTRAWILRLLLPIALILAFSYIIGPDIVRHASVPVTVLRQSAQVGALEHQLAIANVALKKLRATPTTHPMTTADLTKIGQLQSELDRAKQDLDAKDRRIATLEAAAREAQRGPANPPIARPASAMPRTPVVTPSPASPTATFIPTHLRLQFNAYFDQPKEIDKANVTHWSYGALTRKLGEYCFATALGQRCIQTQPNGDRNDADVKTAVVTIFFDKPTTYKDVKADFSGEKYNWEILDKSERGLTILVYPEPAHFVFEVEVTPPTL